MLDPSRKPIRKPKPTDKTLIFKTYWDMLAPLSAPVPVPEYPFDRQMGRKHRFDWAFPKRKVAVEVEGNAWNVRGGGRHMQNSDLEKYNIAVMLGWRVFRFSPSMLKKDPQYCIDMVMERLI